MEDLRSPGDIILSQKEHPSAQHLRLVLWKDMAPKMPAIPQNSQGSSKIVSKLLGHRLAHVPQPQQRGELLRCTELALLGELCWVLFCHIFRLGSKNDPMNPRAQGQDLWACLLDSFLTQRANSSCSVQASSLQHPVGA